MPETEGIRTRAENRQGTVCVSSRSVAGIALLVLTAAAGCRFLDGEQALTAALKVVLPALAVGVVPGALATMLWAPRPQLTLLEVVGFGAALSFGVVHLLTMLAITAHLSASIVVIVLVIASAFIGGRIVWRPPGATVVSADEGIVGALLIGLAIVLFLVGSPPSTFEDQVHVAIARRLSELRSPSFSNIYFAPDIVYTYPFPGTHYFMALIAKLGDIDALFVYQKLRFFWGPAALVMLYLAAAVVFGTRAVACAVASTAIVLVCTGVFAVVPGLSWGQLVPYSHASDVAMTVLLPSLLMTAFAYLQAESRRERAFFFTATSLLVVMLTCVHIRELVQFSVYIACFLGLSLLVAGLRPYGRRAMSLLAVVVAVAAVYTAWHARVDPLVAGIVDNQRERVLSLFASNPLPELLFGPVSAPLADFVPYFDFIWSGLTPFLLFAGPSVILLFRHRPLVWLLSSSTLLYLAVMSIPLVALSYIYLTYFEILFTPIRNIIFFVYLLAGAFLYAVVIALVRLDRTKLSPVIAGLVLGMFALLTTLSVNRTGAGFFAPLLAAYGLTFVFGWVRPAMAGGNLHRVVAALASVLAVTALWPDHPPEPRAEVVNVRWTAGLSDANRETLERQFGLSNAEPTPDRSDEVNAWSYRLQNLSTENVKALVTHPAVLDTHYIDRSTFSVPPHSRAAESPFLGVRHATWLQFPGWGLVIGALLMVVIVAFLAPFALASYSNEMTAALSAAFGEPFYKHALPFFLCLVAFAMWSAQLTLSPVQQAVTSPDIVATPRALIDKMTCVTTPAVPAPLSKVIHPDAPLEVPERTACPPDYALIQWMKQHVSADAVFAINRWNPNLPPLVMPQQIVVSPSLGEPFLEEYRLFERYYDLYRTTIRKYRVQPFFNDVETPTERAVFVKTLGVTHVLVDPEYYAVMRSILDRLPEQFALRYSGGKWAVYEVVRSSKRDEGVKPFAEGPLRMSN